MMKLRLFFGGRKCGRRLLKEQSWARELKEFSFYQSQLFFRLWRMQKARSGTPQRNRGKNMWLRFEPVSVETGEVYRTLSNPSASVLSRTSAKGTKQKRSVKDNKASCPRESGKYSDNLKTQKKIPSPLLLSKLSPVNLLHEDIVGIWCQQLKPSTRVPKEMHLTASVNMLTQFKRIFLS